ncbi:MAG TPA: tRNA (N(6)-L-threonylcarbamoyladenosine(37)-C(2))-methylthiotransferase MtaB [Clostridiaceae bacterium]|nr:tRNA (N(6)-L-threonylcarbamoyladenosine(37)-C(2))-methylthiotransferase MtaB [Clostridiaceae bacterium]
MKRVAFYTLGCKVNQYETEAISELFVNEGYEVVDFDSVADVYVINTCTVTGLSDRKSRQIIRRAKARNENSIVVVAGCYSQTAPGEVESIPGVDLIIGTKERSKIVDFVREVEKEGKKLNVVGNIMEVKDFEELEIETYHERTRAFIKIQEGCNQFCSYCIIPYARGPVRSRNEINILREVKRLADAEFKEIVLTGIHIASYGKDLKNTSLLELIKKVHEVDGIERIRLGSIEPRIITKEFVDTIAKLHKVCPHFHVSLQSGCDEILKRMNRKYTTSEYREAIRLLRENIPDVAVTTDVMVGFPGETDEEFEKSYKFLEEIAFAKMHVFKYSPRKGTPAYSFKDQVPAQKKEERSSRLIELSDKNTLAFNRKFIGRVMPVLFEQQISFRGEDYIEGHTTNYIRVLCKGDNNLKGKIIGVRLKEPVEDCVLGEIEP